MLRQRPFPHELNTMLVLARRVPFSHQTIDDAVGCF